MNDFDERIAGLFGHVLHSCEINCIQVNLGFRCNQHCVHCHLGAGPNRTEMMDWPTAELVLDAARKVRCELVDLTGGAPELNPHFARFVKALCEARHSVQVRTNLTAFLEPGMDSMPQFFRDHRVQIAASLPCYLEKNVNVQRGPGVFAKSIEGIRRLNALGYGIQHDLALNLVHNPLGPSLPPDQASLEADYRRTLRERFGISFSRLLTITNMPIGRFQSDLARQNKDQQYTQLLKDAFNPETVEGLMCRHQISVDWNGALYDCDFNLALRMPVNHDAPAHIRDFDPHALARRRIVTGGHCFGCTAGCGSSCRGALLPDEPTVSETATVGPSDTERPQHDETK